MIAKCKNNFSESRLKELKSLEMQQHDEINKPVRVSFSSKTQFPPIPHKESIGVKILINIRTYSLYRGR